MKNYSPVVHAEILDVIRDTYGVDNRIKTLREMGHEVQELPMGSGGVCQFKIMSDTTRIQIGYGKGRWNYAPVVVLSGRPVWGEFFVEDIWGYRHKFNWEFLAIEKWQDLADRAEVNCAGPYYFNEKGEAVNCFTEEIMR